MPAGQIAATRGAPTITGSEDATSLKFDGERTPERERKKESDYPRLSEQQKDGVDVLFRKRVGSGGLTLPICPGRPRRVGPRPRQTVTACAGDASDVRLRV